MENLIFELKNLLKARILNERNRAVCCINWKCGQNIEVTWRFSYWKVYLISKAMLLNRKWLKEGTSDRIFFKIFNPKIPFLTRFNSTSTFLKRVICGTTEGTSDRRRKWSFRIEATEARRSVGAMNLEESERCWHTSPLFRAPQKKSWPHLLQAVELGRKSKGLTQIFSQTKNLILLSPHLDNSSCMGSYFMLK